MPSYKDQFGNFIKGEELKGRQVKVVIAEVGVEEIKGEGGKEKKLVARFVGKEKGLVLNRTNAEMLERITGSENYEEWAGTPVILYFDPTVKFGHETKGGIRLKAAGAVAGPNGAPSRVELPPITARTRAVPPPPIEDEAVPTFESDSDDEIPFAWLLPFVLPVLFTAHLVLA